MKKSIILILVCIIVIVMALGACAKGFEFRGHKIGNSVEDVIEKEVRQPDGLMDIEEINRITLTYKGVNFLKSNVKIEYDFIDKKLIAISVFSKQDISDIEETFEELLKELEQDYGAPESKEEDDYFEDWSATWYKKDYFMMLTVSKDGYTFSIAPRTK